MNNSSFNSCAMVNSFKKTEEFNVVSLFDGMSCGQIALNELGVKPTYYASEIDKFAIGQTQLNFPDTIQLGDIENWRNWNVDWSAINLILAGSPCQGFSFAGKQLNFNDERSKLFFVFVDILNHCKKFNPDVKFLLENVVMKKEYQHVINQTLGLFPVRINSNLVSAQNRDRLYWTNIKFKMVGLFNEIHSDIPQPKDKGILLKDILQQESEIDEKYYLSEKMLSYFNNRAANFNNGKVNIRKETGKASTITASSSSIDISDNFIKLDKQLNKKADQNKAGCLTGGGHSGGNHSDMDIICVTDVGRRLDGNGIRKDNDNTLPYTRELQFNKNYKTNCLTSVQKDNYLTNGSMLRRLTPLECSRLQTVPFWYKWECSDTQQYKMLGNGWTIEVIKHILSFLLPIGQSAEEKLLKRQKPTKLK